MNEIMKLLETMKEVDTLRHETFDILKKIVFEQGKRVDALDKEAAMNHKVIKEQSKLFDTITDNAEKQGQLSVKIVNKLGEFNTRIRKLEGREKIEYIN